MRFSNTSANKYTFVFYVQIMRIEKGFLPKSIQNTECKLTFSASDIIFQIIKSRVVKCELMIKIALKVALYTHDL